MDTYIIGVMRFILKQLLNSKNNQINLEIFYIDLLYLMIE